MSHRQLRRFGVAILPAFAALAVLGTGAAYASGGTNSGGVNSGGVNSGGSGGGGGTPTTTAPTTPKACASITTFTNTTGYYSVWAAIWTPFSITNGCSSPVNWQMTYTNGTTGAVDFARSSSTQFMSNGTIDEDWAAFSTPYTVTLTVTDATGAVYDTRSALVTTRNPKSPGA